MGMTKKNAEERDSPSALIEARIAELADWRGAMLARLRAIVLEADRDMVEAVKWRKPTNPDGVAVWEHGGIVCTGEIYKRYVKLTFAHGAAVDDPAGLFNAGLNGNARRAIDFHEGDKVDNKALKALIRAAVAHNSAKRAAKPAKKPAKKAAATGSTAQASKLPGERL